MGGRYLSEGAVLTIQWRRRPQKELAISSQGEDRYQPQSLTTADISTSASRTKKQSRVSFMDP